MLRKRLVQELDNKHDKNSVVAQFLDSGTMLGHLDWRTAAVVAPMMDTLTTGFLIKALVHGAVSIQAWHAWAAVSINVSILSHFVSAVSPDH